MTLRHELHVVAIALTTVDTAGSAALGCHWKDDC